MYWFKWTILKNGMILLNTAVREERIGMKQTYKFEMKPLPYDYDALEPNIDKETMMLHYGKHSQGYVNNLNNLLENYPQYQDWTLEKLIYCQNELPDSIRTGVRNNAGGVYNHILYFEGMVPPSKASKPTGKLAEAITKTFGSFEGFYEKLKQMALGQFGSGWAWLATDKQGNVSVLSTPNHDTPLTMDLCPILVTDVWEHAYYLNYQNRRAEYFDNWFQLINWDEAEKRYNSCITK